MKWLRHKPIVHKCFPPLQVTLVNNKMLFNYLIFTRAMDVEIERKAKGVNS